MYLDDYMRRELERIKHSQEFVKKAFEMWRRTNDYEDFDYFERVSKTLSHECEYFTKQLLARLKD